VPSLGGGGGFELEILWSRLWFSGCCCEGGCGGPPGEKGSGDGGKERDCGVFVVESLGVVGVELTRERLLGRRAWMSCMDAKVAC